MSHALTTLCCNGFQGNSRAAADDNIPDYNRCSVIVILKKKKKAVAQAAVTSSSAICPHFTSDSNALQLTSSQHHAAPTRVWGCFFFFLPLSQQGQQRSGHKQSPANTGVILVCHLSQVINADHGLIKTRVLTVRALQPTNALGHLFFPH